jgi:Asp/Glu/hydantoin racemase
VQTLNEPQVTMRILILNPNTTEEVTSLMLDVGRAVASPGVEADAITAPRGFPYIASRAEVQIGGAVALEMLAETKGRYDAAILAAFGDPGLFGARKLFDFPVIGVSEAAMLTACMLGGKFLIVTFASALCGWYRDCVAMHASKVVARALSPSIAASVRSRSRAKPTGRRLSILPTKRLRSATRMSPSSPARRLPVSRRVRGI